MKEKDLQLLASKGTEITPQVLEGLRAQDTGRMYMQAENFARLVDIVPDVTRATNEQFARLNVLNNEGSLSDIYKYILRMSQVMQTELPEETKKKVAEFRALLNVTKTRKSLIDGSETQVVEPSPLTQAYHEKMAAYEAAALAYNTARIDALTASNARAIHYWAMNANILRNKVKAAMSDWVSSGYKNDYEQIAAFIDQVMQRDMALLKQEYRDDLEKAKITGMASGSDFFFTSLVPGNFAKSNGWTNFEFSSGDFQSHSSELQHEQVEDQRGRQFLGHRSRSRRWRQDPGSCQAREQIFERRLQLQFPDLSGSDRPAVVQVGVPAQQGVALRSERPGGEGRDREQRRQWRQGPHGQDASVPDECDLYPQPEAHPRS